MRITRPKKKPVAPASSKGALNYPFKTTHITGQQLIDYIRSFDKMNDLRSGSVYIIQGKEVRI